MHVESLRIQNYRSIQDSGVLSFSPGFNLVVGANNVGKSSLLLCLAARFTTEPHKSIHNLPRPDDPLSPASQVDFTFVVTGEELRRLLFNLGRSQLRFAWPAELEFSDQQTVEASDRLLNPEVVRFHVSGRASRDQKVNWVEGQYSAPQVHRPLVQGGHCHMLVVTIDGVNRTFTAVREATSDPKEDFSATVGALLAQQIYWFSPERTNPERTNLGTAAFGVRNELDPDARNLAEVLNSLQHNSARFGDYCNLVKQVFPSIQRVSVRPSPTGNNFVEVMIWQVDPALEREDLAMPLSQCGTGVGQVLAILYVVRTSEQPRTIVIDEPGSFLHPGASRALIAILKRFRQHQYIIATHSPEILAELSDAPVTVVRWGDSKSVIEQSARTTEELAFEALTEVGARLSDVYGFDKVLWVEGQSDALSLKALLDAMGKPQRGLSIMPVRDTGSFKRREIGEVLYIYRALSMGGALLPPAVLFLFDRDGRSEKEMEDVTRQSKGKVKFLPRRMFENYLLKPTAIAHLFNEVGSAHGITTSQSHVEDWIANNGSSFCEGTDPPQPSMSAWLKGVDGASLLEQLFADLSGNQLFFRKTSHTPRLTVLLHDCDPQAAQEILDLIADVIQ